MRVQRPAAYDTQDAGGWRVMDGDEANAYMDQCEADIAELVEALRQCERELRIMATWAPGPHQARPRRTADAACALIAKHKGGQDE